MNSSEPHSHRLESVKHDSVAALMLTWDGRYILQHRENRPQVSFPGMWGLFGGAREADESSEEALLRELREELSFYSRSQDEFLISVFYFPSDFLENARRTYYVVVIEEPELRALRLAEGDALGIFTIGDILAIGQQVVPLDLCAMLLHSASRYNAVKQPFDTSEAIS